MSPRPPIFVSAVSRELRSARQLVANTLTFLGYEPVWQDIFGTEGGDLREVLRDRIDQCRGVVQLVGQCYGAEAPTPDERFGRASYTQYEALYARERGKKVWYLFIDESFPIDQHEPEPAELQELQAAYRRRIRADAHLFHALTSHDALEAGVLKLRDDLTQLRRGVRQWAAAVAAMLVIITIAVLWLVRGQKQATQKMEQSTQALTSVANDMARLREGLLNYPAAEARVRETSSTKDPRALEDRVYHALARQLGVSADSLRQTVPRLAQNLKDAPEASNFDKATAAYVRKDFVEAEAKAVQAAADAQKSSPPQPADATRALTLAGLAAQRNVGYDKAAEHFLAAEKLTDRTRDPVDWAKVQRVIAENAIIKGQYQDAADRLTTVGQLLTEKLGPENQETLSARGALGMAEAGLGRYKASEMHHRAVAEIEERLLGPEDPVVLWNREMVGTALMNQAKYSEAESEFRQLVAANEKVLGPQDQQTVIARNNLAVAVLNRGNYAEAKSEFEELVRTNEKLVGAEHPNTLLAQYNVGVASLSLDDYPDAESEFRKVLAARTKVLGADHPETLRTARMLALTLDREKKSGEAQRLYQEVLQSCERVPGVDHPETIEAYGAMALTLERQHRMREAKPYCEQALASARKVLGKDHPRTRQLGDLLETINSLMNVPGMD